MKKRILSGLTAFMICAMMIVAPLSMPAYAMTTGPDSIWSGYENSTSYTIDEYLSGFDFVSSDDVDDDLTVGRKYYTENSRAGSFGGERGGSFGGGYPGYRGKTDYDTSSDDADSIVQSVVNNNILNLTFEFNLSITYTEINYCPTYNVYQFVTDGGNYYVQNNITYVSYMYYDTSDDTSYLNNVYYELPDGRNSYNLTADDVFGVYFVYDFLNYDEVIEDDGVTLGLWHFDGDLKDSSVNANDATFVQNASYQFVDSPFNASLFLAPPTTSNDTDQSSVLRFSFNEALGNDFTIEGSALMSKPGNMLKYSIYSSNGSFLDDSVISKQASLYFGLVTDDVSVAKSKIESKFGSGSWSSVVNNNSPYYGDVTTVYKFTPDVNIVTCHVEDALPFFNVDGKASYTGTVSNIYFEHYNWINKPSYYMWDCSIGHYDVTLNSSAVSQYSDIWDNIPADYFYFSFVGDGNAVKFYLNGLHTATISDISAFNKNLLDITNHQTTVYLDELRVSNKALYTGNYVPRTQPFDTNLVLVLPDDAQETNIAVKSNVSVTGTRVGGVKPTYPTNGYVYVYLEGDIVKDVQQYQTDGWYSVDACIYNSGDWISLTNYDMSPYVIEDDNGNDDDTSDDTITPTPTPDDTIDTDNDGIPDIDDSDDDNDGVPDNDDADGILNKLISTITGFIGNLFKSVFGGILDLVNILIDNLNSLLDSFTGITGLIGSLFGFFPSEIVTILSIGLSAVFIIAIIKMFKG